MEALCLHPPVVLGSLQLFKVGRGMLAQRADPVFRKVFKSSDFDILSGIAVYLEIARIADIIFHDDVCIDNTPENVQKAFEFAKKYIDEHPELPAPLITVNSWNEWTETSYLHPDDIYGYGYLETIQNVFKSDN